MQTTSQRENWNGRPVDPGDAWAVCKVEKELPCRLVTHLWELALCTTDLADAELPLNRSRLEHRRGMEEGSDREALVMTSKSRADERG